jgi:hypothetical protein
MSDGGPPPHRWPEYVPWSGIGRGLDGRETVPAAIQVFDSPAQAPEPVARSPDTRLPGAHVAAAFPERDAAFPEPDAAVPERAVRAPDRAYFDQLIGGNNLAAAPQRDENIETLQDWQFEDVADATERIKRCATMVSYDQCPVQYQPSSYSAYKLKKEKGN